MATTEPQKWTATLGSTADVNVLPATTPAGSGRASTSGLFPPVTQLPLDQGGIAPERGDFNALFKYLGEYIYYAMQGGVYTYVTTYDYTAGNFVLHEGSLYLCIAANGPGSVIKYPTNAAYWRQLALTSQLPTVGDGTITVNVAGSSAGSFTTNQGGNSTINIPAASASAFGVVKIGSGITVTNGVISMDGSRQIFFADANSTQDAAIRAAGFWRCGSAYAFWGTYDNGPAGGAWYICYAPNGHTITEVDLRWSYAQVVTPSVNGSQYSRGELQTVEAWIAPWPPATSHPQKGVNVPIVGMTQANEVPFPANPYVPN